MTTDPGERDDEPVLGDDITDIESLGGWEAALSRLLGSEAWSMAVMRFLHERRGASGAKDVDDETARLIYACWWNEPRLMVAIGAAMSPDLRRPLGRFWVTDPKHGDFSMEICDWTAAGVIMARHRSNADPDRRPAPAHGRLSVNDLNKLAPLLGWGDRPVLRAMIDESSLWRLRPEALATLEGVERHVVADATANASAIRKAIATPVDRQQLTLRRRLVALGPEVAGLFGAELARGVTVSDRHARQEAVDLLGRLPFERVDTELKAVAESGTALEASRAIAALVDLAGRSAPDRLPALVSWADEALGQSTSVRVVEAVQRLRAKASRVGFTRPSLPSYDLGRSPRVDDLPVEYEYYRNALLKVINNDDERYSYGGVDWVLAGALDKQPTLAERLTDEHVARVLLVAGSSPFQAGGLRRILTAGDPPPLYLSAVAERQNIAVDRVVHTVGAILAAVPDHWTDSELTEWVAFHADDIVDVLAKQATGPRTGVYTALARAETRPAHVDDFLVVQVTTNRKERDDLYRAVDRSMIGRILPLLVSRSRGERRGAAEWLQVHGTDEAVEPLLAATRSESDDGAKAAMLSALELLDAPIDEFVSQEAITADAKRIMNRKSAWPQSLSWLDAASLPPLLWGDGTPVAPEVGQWLMAAAAKARQAEPSPILQRHVGAMEPASVRVLGRTVLDWWLNYDEEANGAGVTSRGITAVVAASAGGDVVDRVMAYLRRHRGKRRKQGEALIEMLAWIDDPVAIQAVLSIANRFRPKKLSDVAARQAELLAERNGWTVADLADRSVPDGGFDANGRRVFDYAGRTFTASLADDLSLRLVNDENGKSIRSLPRGRADEDAGKIKELRADLSAAKKDLATTAEVQPERLHQAMCAERAWPAQDFLDNLVRHPVMIRLAARLVWRAVERSPDGEDEVTFFRPLTDGHLLDIDDDAFELDREAVVTLAHSRWMSDTDERAWSNHLADYDVQPPFPQLRRQVYPRADALGVGVDEFTDVVVKEGNLRRGWTALGWQNGNVDGFEGYLHNVIKPNPIAGLTAALALRTGISIRHYDDDADVGLGSLTFVPFGEPEDRMAPVPLTEVPTVMLSEMVAEVRILTVNGIPRQPEGNEQ